MEYFYSNFLYRARITMIIVILLCTSVDADIFYISTNGSNNNNGSINSPWRTIIYAWNNSKRGDTVFVRGGTYSEQEIWLVNGTGGGDQFWTLKAYPEETPVFTNARFIADDDYIRIQGFRLTGNSRIEAVSWEGIHNHIELLDNVFIVRYSPAIEYISNDGLIQGNTIDLSSSDRESHGIYIMHGTNNIVRNNFVTGMYKYGIHIYDEEKYPKEGPVVIKNLLVEHNIVTGSQERSGIIISSGADPPGGILIDGVTIRNNIISNNKDDGIHIEYGGTNTNIDIYNNVIFNNNLNGIYINWRIADHIRIKNNIFVSNGANNINAPQVNDLTVSHNLYWQPSSIGRGVTDNDAIYKDPLFVNADEGDFHLRENSPAIDAGVDVGILYNGNAPDLGAFEYGQSSTSVKVTSFKVYLKDDGIELNWQTPSAYNNFGFDIERGRDGRNYQRIGFVKGYKAANVAQTYKFFDRKVKEGQYYYRLKLLKLNGTFEYSPTVEITVSRLDQFNLQQNYPNPFNPSTEICYNLPYAVDVNLSIFDITGRKIITLVQEKQSAGSKTVKWDGRDKNNQMVTSGVFFCRLKADEFSEAMKMSLIQ